MMEILSPPKRRWFRFSLRTNRMRSLVFTLVASCSCAAVAEEQTLEAQIQKRLKVIKTFMDQEELLTSQLRDALKQVRSLDQELTHETYKETSESGKSRTRRTRKGDRIARELHTATETRNALESQLSVLTESGLLSICDPLGTVSREEHQASLKFLSGLRVPLTRSLSMVKACDLIKVGELDKALEGLAVATGEDSTGELAANVHAWILGITGTFALSDTTFERELKRNRHTEWCHLFKALVDSHHGNHEQARKGFEMAVRIAPRDPVARRVLALYYATCPEQKVRSGQKALTAATTAMRLGSKTDWAVFDALAAAYAEQGEFTKAVKAADQAASLALGSNRKLALDRKVLYERKEKLRLDWK